jgi:pogo transposable element with ZNF domain
MLLYFLQVDNFYVKNFFTLLRSVCTAAVHTKMGYIGGINKYVEVGVISLGTTSQDGNQRQVKVEVLGVMDYDNKRVRLMAVEPMADSDRNLRKRFSKILEPLTSWVHPASTILTDFSIDKSTLQALGFNTVIQNNATDLGAFLGGKRRHNANIMDYLRKVIYNHPFKLYFLL